MTAPEISKTRSARAELIVLRWADDTGGEYTEVEVLFPARAPASPVRVLPGHEVRIEVQTGRLELAVNGEVKPLRAGEALTISAGVPHRIAVADGHSGPARFLWRVRPALADETELERAFGLAR
jgi:quercetin dioxygenase-like cupin family protein